MPNLIQQMDILKGLTDQQLTQEMQTPSGQVPPFVVASEVSRRKDMRQRYAADQAMAQPPRTTVAQDLAQGFGQQPGGAMPGMAAPGQPAGPVGRPGGLAAAAQPPGGSPVRGFASGGLVNALDYDGMAKQYQDMLSSQAHDRDQAAALALISGGAGILGGGHSNFGQNLAAGLNAGIGTYTDRLKSLDSRDMDALNGLINLGGASDSSQAAAAKLDPNNPLNQPNSIQEFNAYSKMTPDQQAAFVKLNQPGSAAMAQDKKDSAEAIADGVYNGTIDPGLGGQYSMKPMVEAILAKKHPGFSLLGAQREALAAQTYIKSLNGTRQLVFRQSIDTADGVLGELQNLSDEWKRSNYPILNAAQFEAAKHGVLGPKAQSLAAQFQAQLSEASTVLADVFRNGNSPTDKALQKADQMFSRDTSGTTFDDLINLARRNLGYRRDALAVGPAGVGKDSPYYPPDTNVSPGGATSPGTDVDAETSALLDKYK